MLRARWVTLRSREFVHGQSQDALKGSYLIQLRALLIKPRHQQRHAVRSHASAIPPRSRRPSGHLSVSTATVSTPTRASKPACRHFRARDEGPPQPGDVRETYEASRTLSIHRNECKWVRRWKVLLVHSILPCNGSTITPVLRLDRTGPSVAPLRGGAVDRRERRACCGCGGRGGRAGGSRTPAGWTPA
jgi:hypothetical protein